MPEHELIPAANQEIIRESGAELLLQQIRPQWKAKNLIQRVNRLLAVDPTRSQSPRPSARMTSRRLDPN